MRLPHCCWKQSAKRRNVRLLPVLFDSFEKNGSIIFLKFNIIELMLMTDRLTGTYQSNPLENVFSVYLWRSESSQCSSLVLKPKNAKFTIHLRIYKNKLLLNKLKIRKDKTSFYTFRFHLINYHWLTICCGSIAYLSVLSINNRFPSLLFLAFYLILFVFEGNEERPNYIVRQDNDCKVNRCHLCE